MNRPRSPQSIFDSQTKSLERWLSIILSITVLDTLYLSWRFIALYAGWVAPGTALCSWSSWIDCDRVLQTPQARAFMVPNAILGLGFYTGALLLWTIGRRLGPAYRPHLIRGLALCLGVASLVSLWFWRLLVSLPALCPFCPWNHVLTYAALALAIRIWRATPHPSHHESLRPLLKLSVLCVMWFLLLQGLWFLAEATVLH
jgi:uncharacterized membrane protein